MCRTILDVVIILWEVSPVGHVSAHVSAPKATFSQCGVRYQRSFAYNPYLIFTTHKADGFMLRIDDLL